MAKELFLDGKPSLTSRATTLMDDFLDLNSERDEEPGEDDVVHLSPTWKSGGNNVEGDVVVEGVVLQRQQDDVAPVCVVVGEWVKHDGDHAPNVLHIGSLGVQVGDGGDLLRVGGILDEGCGRGRHKVLLDGGEVTLEGIQGDLLLLPHEGNLLLTLMGGGEVVRRVGREGVP
jgi:hypothetical protein